MSYHDSSRSRRFASEAASFHFVVSSFCRLFEQDLPNDAEATDITRKAQQKASAWYIVTYQAQNRRVRLLSFAWVVAEKLCELKAAANRKASAAAVAAGGTSFSGGIRDIRIGMASVAV